MLEPLQNGDHFKYLKNDIYMSWERLVIFENSSHQTKAGVKLHNFNILVFFHLGRLPIDSNKMAADQIIL